MTDNKSQAHADALARAIFLAKEVGRLTASGNAEHSALVYCELCAHCEANDIDPDDEILRQVTEEAERIETERLSR